MSTVSYKINGYRFEDLGMIVTGSHGVLDVPKIKKPFSINMPNSHGEILDLTNVFYESKIITLDCVISAIDNEAFVTAVNNFKEVLSYYNISELQISINGIEPLIYRMYIADGIEIEKKWRNRGEVVGSFSLKMIEPEPVKMILKYESSGLFWCGLSFTSTTPVNVYWSRYEEEIGVQSVSGHSYDSGDVTYIIITGQVENINISDMTNVTIIWNRLL